MNIGKSGKGAAEAQSPMDTVGLRLKPKEDEFIDPGDIDSLREAIGKEVIHSYNLALPNGKYLKLNVRQCGIAELMEAQNGEKQSATRAKTIDFNSRLWRRQNIRKINYALLEWQFVDDMDNKRADLSQGQLPFSLLRGDQFNELMELAYPGFLVEFADIQNKVDDIRSQSVQDISQDRPSLGGS